MKVAKALIDQLEITLEMAEDQTPKKLRNAMLRARGSGRSSTAKAKSAREFRARAPRRERGKK